MIAAVHRRAGFEVGLRVRDLELALPHFRYRAVDASGIVEHEICPVYVARTDEDPRPHPDEVAETAGWTPSTSPLRSRHALGVQPLAGHAGRAACIVRRTRREESIVIALPSPPPRQSRRRDRDGPRRPSTASGRWATARVHWHAIRAPPPGASASVPCSSPPPTTPSTATPSHSPHSTRSPRPSSCCTRPSSCTTTSSTTTPSAAASRTSRRIPPARASRGRRRSRCRPARRRRGNPRRRPAAARGGRVSSPSPTCRRHARELLGLVEDAVIVSAAGELADVENAVSAGDADADASWRPRATRPPSTRSPRLCRPAP